MPIFFLDVHKADVLSGWAVRQPYFIIIKKIHIRFGMIIYKNSALPNIKNNVDKVGEIIILVDCL